MLKIKGIFRFDVWRSICLCQKMSSSIMKIFVPVITFFKTSIHVIGVKTCKLDIIGVKMAWSLQSILYLLPRWGEGWVRGRTPITHCARENFYLEMD